jgi:hypothetical protein
MPHTETALLTTFRVRLRGELDAERLLGGPTIVEEHDGATILATADPDAQMKLRSIASVEAIERIGRAILVPEQTASSDRG